MNSKFYTFTIDGHNYIETHSENNLVSNLLVPEQGYEEFFKVNNYLIEKCNLKLIDNRGITDMASSFEYNGAKLTLRYLSLVDGMLTLECSLMNEKQLMAYRMLVHDISENVLGNCEIEKER